MTLINCIAYECINNTKGVCTAEEINMEVIGASLVCEDETY